MKTKIKRMIIVPMTLGVLIGLIISIYGYKYDRSFLKSIHAYIDNYFLKFIYTYVCLVVGCIIGIIIHESGHLVTGLLSGYEFVSFRICSMVWVKENGKLSRKRFNIMGTAGQCLMMPPDSDTPEKVPFVLYFLGGGLFNLIAAVICIPIGFVISNFYFSMLFLTFGFISAWMCFLNLIPLNIRVPNDGYNIVLYSRNKAKRIVLYKELRLNGLLYKGYELSDIPENLFDFGEESDGLGEIFQAGLYAYKKDFSAAQNLLEKVLNRDKLISIYEYEAKSELLFCKVVNGAPEHEIEELYDKTLKKYILFSAKTQISKRRLMYAYYSIYKHDMESAEREYNKAVAMKDTYPIPGELKSELSLIEFIRTSVENGCFTNISKSSR